MKAIADLFDLVPGWVYALICAGLMLVVGAERMQVLTARADKAQTVATLEHERGEHQRALAVETAKVLDLTNKLNAARAAQETEDENRRLTRMAAARDLDAAAAAHGGRLRDPNATGCRDAAEPADPAPADGGPADGASPGGLLSPDLTRLLQRLADEAQSINDAYSSCRADAMNLRRILAVPNASP